MRLLPPQEVKSKIQSQTTVEILRTKEVNAAADKARKRLANAEADFNETLARHRNLWAKEEEGHTVIVDQRARELEQLERRREKALVPIELEKKKAGDLLSEARTYLESAKQRESDADYLNERLQDKLDEVGQREQDVIIKFTKLEIQEQGINVQQEQTRESVKRLSKEISEFTLWVQKAEKDIDERKTALVLWDRSLQAREEALKRKETSLSEWAIRLQDERGVLDRAFKRAKIST